MTQPRICKRVETTHAQPLSFCSYSVSFQKLSLAINPFNRGLQYFLWAYNTLFSSVWSLAHCLAVTYSVSPFPVDLGSSKKRSGLSYAPSVSFVWVCGVSKSMNEHGFLPDWKEIQEGRGGLGFPCAPTFGLCQKEQFHEASRSCVKEP